VVRIGEDGAIQWSSVFGENGNSAVTECWEDSSGFIHCCGFTSDAGGDKNGFWAKMGADGALVGPVRRFGSAQADEFTRMAPMGVDRLLLSGYTKGFGNDNHAALWTVVTDLDGNFKFSKTFSLAESDLVSNDLIALPGNQYLFAVGELLAPLGQAILLKLSVDLDQLFANRYKGGSESDVFSQVISTVSGDLQQRVLQTTMETQTLTWWSRMQMENSTMMTAARRHSKLSVGTCCRKHQLLFPPKRPSMLFKIAHWVSLIELLQPLTCASR
jgi:hypothetical protein